MMPIPLSTTIAPRAPRRPIPMASIPLVRHMRAPMHLLLLLGESPHPRCLVSLVYLDTMTALTRSLEKYWKSARFLKPAVIDDSRLLIAEISPWTVEHEYMLQPFWSHSRSSSHPSVDEYPWNTSSTVHSFQESSADLSLLSGLQSVVSLLLRMTASLLAYLWVPSWRVLEVR